jgi:tRNA A-37 threonylcarbamoyl transferase component Bud32
MATPHDPLRRAAQPTADLNATAGGPGPPAAVPTPAPASAGRYALGDEIARGGMGVIYRATDTALSREVAVKVLQERFALDSDTARRFTEEARIGAQLQHPGIPPVHDLGTLPDGRPFLAMKLIKGQTLERLLAARSDPSADRGRFVAAFEAVCQAVAFAHAHQVIHRDLKPANVMVGAFGEVQLMDWGLAKVLSARHAETAEPEATRADTLVRSLRDSDGLFTQAGSVLGTPAYMAPEQALGAVAKVDQRSDVFGLGAILAVLLTGRPPFAASSAETARVKAAQGDVADCLARLDACGAEPELVALCKRCMSPRAADRPADGDEVARAVAALPELVALCKRCLVLAERQHRLGGGDQGDAPGDKRRRLHRPLPRGPGRGGCVRGPAGDGHRGDVHLVMKNSPVVLSYPSEPALVCFGYVDGPAGVTTLAPFVAGRVTRVEVQEN